VHIELEVQLDVVLLEKLEQVAHLLLGAQLAAAGRDALAQVGEQLATAPGWHLGERLLDSAKISVYAEIVRFVGQSRRSFAKRPLRRKREAASPPC
jgi:hypothetical protein